MSSTNFTWSILEHFVPNIRLQRALTKLIQSYQKKNKNNVFIHDSSVLLYFSYFFIVLTLNRNFPSNHLIKCTIKQDHVVSVYRRLLTTKTRIPTQSPHSSRNYLFKGNSKKPQKNM